MSRPLSCLCGALLLLSAGFCPAQNLSWINPEKLPEVLRGPVRLAATTDPAAQGQDYKLIPPGGTATLATITGPAILFRVWSTTSKNTAAEVTLNLDGRQQTLYAKGALPAGAADRDPLRSLDGQAYWSYIPLGVKQKAVFTGRNRDPQDSLKFYLQVGYRQATPAQLRALTKPAVERMRQALGFTLQDPFLGGQGQPQQATLEPGKPWEVTFSQPSLVRVLGLNIGTATYEQVAGTRLTVTCDGVKTMDVPLNALFCQYWALTEYTSAATAYRNQELVLRLPMPVKQSLTLGLDRYGGRPVPSVAARLFAEPLPQAPRYQLCAQYFSGISVRQEPLRLANLQGSGMLVGVNLAVDGLDHRSFAFLEGNDQLYVDGATRPSLEGTGTEDIFNGAWYFEAGVLSRAFHGVTYKQDKQPPRVAAYRYYLPDLVSFRSGLTYDLQHGSRNGSPDTLYRAVVLWYQAPPVIITEPAEAKTPVPTAVTPVATEDTGLPPGEFPWASVGAAVLVVAGAVIWLRRRGKTHTRGG